jgi:hypothetical protein
MFQEMPYIHLKQIKKILKSRIRWSHLKFIFYCEIITKTLIFNSKLKNKLECCVTTCVKAEIKQKSYNKTRNPDYNKRRYVFYVLAYV